MNAELKAKWIAALRSGEYKQGRGKLKRNDLYCCLGVLCEVADIKLVTEEGLDYFYIEECDDTSYSELPELILNKVELEQNQQAILIDLNDGYNSSDPYAGVPQKDFNEIADWIEKNL